MLTWPWSCCWNHAHVILWVWWSSGIDTCLWTSAGLGRDNLVRCRHCWHWLRWEQGRHWRLRGCWRGKWWLIVGLQLKKKTFEMVRVIQDTHTQNSLTFYLCHFLGKRRCCFSSVLWTDWIRGLSAIRSTVDLPPPLSVVGRKRQRAEGWVLSSLPVQDLMTLPFTPHSLFMKLGPTHLIFSGFQKD